MNSIRRVSLLFLASIPLDVTRNLLSVSCVKVVAASILVHCGA